MKRFSRKTGVRGYKKLVVIVSEGTKTEPEYFNGLKRKDLIRSDFNIIIHSGKHSAPNHLIKLAKQEEQHRGIRKNDSLWILCDKSDWSPEQIDELRRWEKDKDNRNLGLSAPCFEQWVLWHYIDRDCGNTCHDCTQQVKAQQTDARVAVKGIDEQIIEPQRISQAIRRARIREVRAAKAFSDVFKIVEFLLRQDI